MEAIINYLDKYSPQILFFQVGILIILSAVFIWVWYYNRRRFHHLKHQIPASVVKSYLDSIIQNSTSLKSSLFRGGGLDVDGSGVPSVLPLDQLTNIAGTGSQNADSGASSHELNALRAQVAQLQAEVGSKQKVIKDLEGKKVELEGMNKAKQERIEELERLLAQKGGDAGAASQEELNAVKKERDQLKQTLQQYEVIEDDLANLKRLQQENEQLRNALASAGAAVPVMAQAIEAEPTPVQEEVVEAVEEEAPVEIEAASEAAPEQAAKTDDKTPEDLLSEFEKMLG